MYVTSDNISDSTRRSERSTSCRCRKAKQIAPSLPVTRLSVIEVKIMRWRRFSMGAISASLAAARMMWTTPIIRCLYATVLCVATLETAEMYKEHPWRKESRALSFTFQIGARIPQHSMT